MKTLDTALALLLKWTWTRKSSHLLDTPEQFGVWVTSVIHALTVRPLCEEEAEQVFAWVLRAEPEAPLFIDAFDEECEVVLPSPPEGSSGWWTALGHNLRAALFYQEEGEPLLEVVQKLASEGLPQGVAAHLVDVFRIFGTQSSAAVNAVAEILRQRVEGEILPMPYRRNRRGAGRARRPALHFPSYCEPIEE